MTTHDRLSPFLAATMAACLRTSTAPPTAPAANDNAGWRYIAPTSPGGHHVALIEQDGLQLTYAGSREEGVTISADLWRPADVPAGLRQQGRLQVDITLRSRGMISGTVYAVLEHFLYVNFATVPSAGAQLVIPDTCWLSRAMRDPHFAKITITAPEYALTGSLPDADAAIQQVNARITMVDERVYLLLVSGRPAPGLLARKKYFLDTFMPLRGHAPPSSVEG